jgi:DUF4097 and DUF4098 domain-containing protein YvlB
MKHLTGLLILCMCSCFTEAQQIIEKNLAFLPGKSIQMNIQIADSIRIITWNKNEVYAKASVNINDNKDNDAYVTTFDDAANTIDINAKFQDQKKTRSKDSCNCCNYNSKIYWDVYIPEQSSFAVETIDGNIIIEGNTKDIKAHTISGFIDMRFASSRKADLKMSTISGTIYTDLSINENAKARSGNSVVASYNGGGEAVQLETISGDIFLRKE